MIVEVGWHFASLHRFWNLSAYEFIASVFLNDSTLFLGVLNNLYDPPLCIPKNEIF